ncbi:MAG: radical SAM protein, partial [Oscillospiraceae bacterium]|nr:radical SAM protein [Oscillospiraceae bacterium]
MSNELMDLIQTVKKQCLDGDTQSRDVMLRLLDIPLNTKEYDELCRAANEAAQVITGSSAYLWGAIGLDYARCPMNCMFCSFGEKWGVVKREIIYSPEEILEQVRRYAAEGIHFIVLRTTEFYHVASLKDLLQNIRSEVSGEYELILNIGEFDVQTANEIYEAGASGIYHAVRLREGIQTPFDPRQRMATLESILRSPLKLIHLVEPVGPEHTNEEIADVFFNSMRYGVAISGAMARIPVKGTPLGEEPAISKERLAQIIAVLRLTGGYKVPDICVHPASQEAVNAGANVVVIETGANPRDQRADREAWRGFGAGAARLLLQNAGYTVGHKK